MKNSTTSKDPYQIVTDAIIAKLEEGVVPWHKPWNAGVGFPRNIDGQFYRGINILLLGTQDYADPRWGTFKAIQAKNGKVRKGEKGTLVVFWKQLESKTEVDAKGNPKKFWMLRYYYVFNVLQADFEKPLPIIETDALNYHEDEDWQDAADAITAPYFEAEGAPSLHHGHTAASYSPSQDVVNMPDAERFESLDAYYWTLYHELTHSTGHEKRLNRSDLTSTEAKFGTDPYAREELVAEIGAAMLGTFAGLPDRTPQSAAYIAAWLTRLRDDKKLVVSAAARAQKAVECIMGTDASEPESEAQNG